MFLVYPNCSWNDGGEALVLKDVLFLSGKNFQDLDPVVCEFDNMFPSGDFDAT